MPNPADLCTYILPNGSRCRQVTLRDKLFCRHHIRLRKIRRRSAHQMTVDRLRTEMARFDFIELLYQLSVRLQCIQSAVDGYPEARAILFLVLEHLDRLRQFNQETGYSVAEESGLAPESGRETLPNL
jgi:hypothetical protein